MGKVKTKYPEIKIGNVYGLLTVVGYEKVVKRDGIIQDHYWLCKCENCGSVYGRSALQLKTGKASCRCKSAHRKNGDRYHQYGESSTRLHRAWYNMLTRCAKDERYVRKGISVCDEWKDYYAFKRWALDHGYDEQSAKNSLTLDRIDNAKGYSPDNCRWTTYKRQNNNRDSNIYLVINGKKKTLKEWAEVTGINYGSLKSKRIRDREFNVEDFISFNLIFAEGGDTVDETATP